MNKIYSSLSIYNKALKALYYGQKNEWQLIMPLFRGFWLNTSILFRRSIHDILLCHINYIMNIVLLSIDYFNFFNISIESLKSPNVSISQLNKFLI